MAPKQDEPSSIVSMHYGSINVQNADDNDEEYAPLVVPSTPPDSSIDKHKKRWNSPRILAAAAAAALFLVVLTTFRVTRHQHQQVKDSGDEQEERGSGPKMFSSAAVSPVSMGLQSTERRQDASPSPIWGNVTGPLPTNSWYLVRWWQAGVVVAKKKILQQTTAIGTSFIFSLRSSFLLLRTWFRTAPPTSPMIRPVSTRFRTLSIRQQQLLLPECQEFGCTGPFCRRAQTTCKWWTTTRTPSAWEQSMRV